jgi:signal transduction histidine kinase
MRDYLGCWMWSKSGEVFGVPTQEHEHERMGGSGLGLATSQELVEAYGGTIKATSEGLGQGTTARFALPKFYKSKVIRKARSTCCIISVDNDPR